MLLGNREIKASLPPYFIADIASNHDNDLDRAFHLIELAKEAGADAAKFQNFRADTIVSKGGFESLTKQLSHQSTWSKSVYEVYKECSIQAEWTRKLKEKCDQVGIEYMTSPYDYASVELVDPYVNAYKIGSGDITYLDLLEHIARKKKPVILATGASTLEEVALAVNTILATNKDLILVQCNTNYTGSLDNFKYINLQVLSTYQRIYPQLILGLSDHTPGHATVLGAIALGARVIEKHFTDDNQREGPDHKFSMNPKSWQEMVNRAKEVWLALGDGEKKLEENELDAVIIQRRAMYFTKDLEVGSILKKEDLIPLRPIPALGIPPYEIHKLLGKKLKAQGKKDTLITWEHVE